MSHHYDLAIVGGGMVGASLALAVSRTAPSLRIAIFEAFPLPSPEALEAPPSYDARATALALGSARIFSDLGLWRALQEEVSAITKIEVSDRGHFGATHLDAASQNVEALGYVIENQRLGKVLLENLKGSDIDLFAPAEVVSARAREDGMHFGVERDGNFEEFSADLLVMADGGRSPLREGLGIDYRTRDYEQCAIIANLGLSRPHRGIAYERFTETGPMALLPLGERDGEPRGALVWSVPLEQADEVLALSDGAFLERLQAQFGYRAGRFVRVGERHSYPLQLMRAQEQYRRGLVVLGNAAHTLHPIAGQGFNLALRGAMTLADTLCAAHQSGKSLGDPKVLRDYGERVAPDQELTIGFSDSTTRLFSNSRTELVVARNLGLLGLELMTPVKQAFARRAMGFGGAS